MVQGRRSRYGENSRGKRYLIKTIQSTKNSIAAATLATGMALLTSCGHGSGQIDSHPFETALQRAGGLQITMSPALLPAFDPNISDYTVRYKSGSQTQITVDAPRNVAVSVAGQASQPLNFTTQVTLTPGQSFPIVVSLFGHSKTYNVRCLPTDFPAWTTERSGIPQAEYYIIAPNPAIAARAAMNYVILVDGYGVPLWWYHSDTSPIDAKVLSSGNLAWTRPISGEERRLDGKLVHTFKADASIGGTLDTHEILLLPNGNYLFIANVKRGPVDLSLYGSSPAAEILDNVIEETTPDGTLVWYWSSMDHISVAETDARWRQFLVQKSPADPYHMNSIEPNGASYVVSFRHLDAVIQIDRATGNIQWKLGGSQRPESLKFVGDSYDNFSGQHDARILPDGTLTLQDNGSFTGRSPRAVRYTIDSVARTAGLVEQVTDPDVSEAICCGNARKLSGGNWVMSWGLSPFVTELTPVGKRVFRVTFLDHYFSYRVAPVPFGTLSRAALRQGMDAQFPR